MRKEHLIAVLLLLIPLIFTIIVILPMPAEFTLQGKMVPVTDIGIAGSVYFSVVETGITNNLFERWGVIFAYQDNYAEIDFTSIDFDERDEYEAWLYDPEPLSYTAEQAVIAISELVPEHKSTTDDTQRTNELLTELEGYYGDSLGLMVAIGLYEEANGVNFSNRLNRKISGTGTMEEEGWVSSIGALEQKLLGAEAQGMDLFFVPADYDWMGEEGNEAEAQRVKTMHGLELEIIPVETLTEAITYLNTGYIGG
jgi:PDZ domain-containing protein